MTILVLVLTDYDNDNMFPRFLALKIFTGTLFVVLLRILILFSLRVAV